MSVILLILFRIKEDINTRTDVRFHDMIQLLFTPEGTWGICHVPGTGLHDQIYRMEFKEKEKES